MKNNLLPLLMVAAVAGASAASLISLLIIRANDVASEMAAAEIALVPAAESDPKLRTELEQLRAENEKLRVRLGALEVREPSSERILVGEYVSMSAFQELEEKVAEMLRPSPSAPGEPHALKAQVEEALSAVRQDEAEVRAQRALEKQAAQLEGRVSKMTNWLGLSTFQQDEMRVLLTQRDERNNELTRQWKQGGDPEVLGAQKQTNAQLHWEGLQQVLTPEQLETMSSAGKRSRD